MDGRKLRGKRLWRRGGAAIDVYGFEFSEYRGGSMVYSGAGISFNAPLLCIDISGNWLKADWNDQKVEVWI